MDGGITPNGTAWQSWDMGKMHPLRRALGLVLVMIGFTWLMLGAGLLQGSVMSGQTVWAVVGGIIVVIGVGILTLRTGQRR